MPKGTVTDVDERPLVLTMRHVQAIIGCHKDRAYALAHTKGFPTVRLGKSIRGPRDRFLRGSMPKPLGGSRHPRAAHTYSQTRECLPESVARQ